MVNENTLPLKNLRQLLHEESSLTLFQKVLLTTDGSVTELLSMYTGEQIRAEKIEHSITYGGGPQILGCSENAQFLHRKILLKGSGKSYLFAESFFVFDRFSTSMQYKLLHTDAPIGLLWRQEKVEMYREIVGAGIEICERTASYFDMPGDTRLLSRTYLIFQGGGPLGVITEKFPLAYFH